MYNKKKLAVYDKKNLTVWLMNQYFFFNHVIWLIRNIV